MLAELQGRLQTRSRAVAHWRGVWPVRTCARAELRPVVAIGRRRCILQHPSGEVPRRTPAVELQRNRTRRSFRSPGGVVTGRVGRFHRTAYRWQYPCLHVLFRDSSGIAAPTREVLDTVAALSRNEWFRKPIGHRGWSVET
jgi:hypothetical protein